MKRAVLVNGVTASGKSTVARALSQAKGWPLLTLDTIKEAIFEHLGTGDRDYNRLLGKAAIRRSSPLSRISRMEPLQLSTHGSAFSPPRCCRTS